jgi:CBS domain-containing protein
MLASLKVRDYMAVSKIAFTPDMEVLRAIQKLLELGLSGAPVIDQHGNLIGFLSEKDCMQVALNTAYQQDGAGGHVAEFMTTGVDTIDVDAPILEVAELFLKGTYKRYPVVLENRLVGTITRHHILKALQDIATPDHSSITDKQSTKQTIHI